MQDLPKINYVSNLDFYTDMNAISFLRDVGRHFRVNSMITRESVKNRMVSEEGISYTEFSYQILQGYDFYRLHKEQNCQL